METISIARGRFLPQALACGIKIIAMDKKRWRIYDY
jgi:hypothetical protein